MLTLHNRIYDREIGIIKLLQHSLHRLLTLNVVERVERCAYDVIVNEKHSTALDRPTIRFFDTLRAVGGYIVVFVEFCGHTDSHIANIIHFDERAPLSLLLFIAALSHVSRLVKIPTNLEKLLSTSGELGKCAILARRLAFVMCDADVKKRFNVHFAARSPSPVLKWPDCEIVKTSNARKSIRLL